MLLYKLCRGVRVTRVKVRGDQVFVRLRNPPGGTRPNTWIRIPFKEYQAGLKQVYPGDGPDLTVSFFEGDKQ